jgi:hypothetical protein
MVSARAQSSALRGRVLPIRSVTPPAPSGGSAYGASAAAARPTYTPWTGGGDSRFVTAPGDNTIEYGVGRTTGGSSNLGNTPAPAPSPAPEPRAPQPPDWRDSAYNAQIAALNRALQDFETGAQTRAERYGQDFTTGLSRMGFRPGEGFQAAPDLENLTQPMARSMSAGAEGGVAVPQGQWDIEGEFDRTSAAARGTRGMRDEFAGRGTLRSSDFAKSFGDFQNRLGQQLEAMETGRTRFGQDLATELGQFRTRTEEQRSAAEAAAQNRAIMQAISSRGF